MKKIIFKSIFISLSIYVVICTLLYFFQEKLIFYPDKLKKEYEFNFHIPFKEMDIKVDEQVKLNGILFKSNQSSKDLIFYLHGNAGALDSWGYIAEYYTKLGFDLFILDYRGFGKSNGNIESEAQLHHDIQLVYNKLKQKYKEQNIIIVGYSIGTGLAAKLASENKPKMLILQAPYYNFTYLVNQKIPFIPTFLIRYQLNTNTTIQKCKMPIAIFHGDKDNVINYNSSLKLQELLKDSDKVTILKGRSHEITVDSEYLEYISTID